MVAEGSTDLRYLESKLIEDCLARGYLPAEVKSEWTMANTMTKEGYPVMSYHPAHAFWPVKKYAVAVCYTGFAGKKAVLKLWKGTPETFPKTILNPFQARPQR